MYTDVIFYFILSLILIIVLIIILYKIFWKFVLEPNPLVREFFDLDKKKQRQL
jgi:flagellar biogenesis protein FliO